VGLAPRAILNNGNANLDLLKETAITPKLWLALACAG
jgi:hypothetical protein